MPVKVEKNLSRQNNPLFTIKKMNQTHEQQQQQQPLITPSSSLTQQQQQPLPNTSSELEPSSSSSTTTPMKAQEPNHHHGDYETNISPSTMALSSSPLLLSLQHQPSTPHHFDHQHHYQPHHLDSKTTEQEGGILIGSSPQQQQNHSSSSLSGISNHTSMSSQVTSSSLSSVGHLTTKCNNPHHQPSTDSATLKQLQRRKELENWRKNRRITKSTTALHSMTASIMKSNNTQTTKSVSRKSGVPSATCSLHNSRASQQQVPSKTVVSSTLAQHLETSSKKRKLSEQSESISHKKVSRVPLSSSISQVMRQEAMPLGVQQPSKRNDNVISFTNLLKIDKYLPGSNAVQIHQRVKQAEEKENTALNISSILIVDDKENVEEDRHMLDNIAKIADSIEEENIPPSISLASSTGLSSASTTLNQTSSVLLDVSCLDKSEPRSARKSLKQKSFLSSGNGSSFFSTSTGFSPLPSKTPLSAFKSATLKLSKNPTHNSYEEEATKLNHQDSLANNNSNNCSLQSRDTGNPSREEIEYLKAKIVDLEERLRKESMEKDFWKESYKNLLSSTRTNQPANVERVITWDDNLHSSKQLE